MALKDFVSEIRRVWVIFPVVWKIYRDEAARRYNKRKER